MADPARTARPYTFAVLAIAIVEGLQAGDRVALSPPDTVQDGQSMIVSASRPAKT